MKIAAVLVFLATDALACKCLLTKSPQEGWDRSDAVFSGRVLRLKKTPGNDRYVTQADFEVLAPWKGVEGKEISIRTGQGGGDCGYPFEEGKRYLVFAYGKDDLRTDSCTRTVELETAKKDVKFLKTKVLKEPPLFGSKGKTLYWDFYKKDVGSILQLILNDERLDKVLTAPPSGDHAGFVVPENRYTKGVRGLKRGGKDVQVLEPFKTDKSTPLLNFSEVTFDREAAVVRFVYSVSRVKGEVALQKDPDGWKITRCDLVGL